MSPTFGGQTVQPEFELLTGLSQFQMSVPNPFIHIIEKYKYFPALPSALKNLGYFIKCTNLYSQIEMFLENDLPLVVKYSVASLGEIKLCLAPLPSS